MKAISISLLGIALTCPALASVISVNFSEKHTNQTLLPETSAGFNNHKFWNNTGGAPTGKIPKLLDKNGAPTTAKVEWSATSMWGDVSANNDATSANGNAQLRRGYLDDKDAPPTWKVKGIPYQNYHVVIYFSNETSGGSFSPISINGTQYRTLEKKQNHAGLTKWNDSNSLIAKNLRGNLNVTLLPRSNNTRSTVAGFQIINAISPSASTLIGVGDLSINLQNTK
ncbi:hypothetical protein [Rubritalea tangerina]|uniref:Uncharacterized protein n=1 Tax=Rubritalea tangerina TaxID=430798 RepID=A0ABW4Z636_9BACT